MPNIFNFNPQTQGYINNALDTLTLWLGGTPKPRPNPNDNVSQDQGGDQGYPSNQPTPTKGGNTLLYVLLGAGGAALVTYLIVKKKS
jgi:hypothetical protein